MSVPILTATAVLNLRADIIAFRAMHRKLQEEFNELGLLFERLEYFTNSLLDDSVDDLPLF